LNPPWKKIANNASRMHEEQGYSFVTKNNDDAISFDTPLINTIPEEKVVTVKGKRINAKLIRSFTWENRNQRFMSRDRAFVWTFYNSSEDTSYLGVGAEVSPDTLDRVPQDSIIRGYESEDDHGS